MTFDTLSLSKIAALFSSVKSPAEERQQLRLAIAEFELLAAQYTPTGNDVGENYREGMKETGQQDCIDESLNTSTYISYMLEQGWLKWHKLEERAFRAPWLFDQHWSAQISQINTGTRYVVDSWFFDNGQPAVIQTLADWLDKQEPIQP
ncbi:MAG: hypothetical protein HUJ30_05845 [Gammaproteobacteria bacterium]|nr:hypothetical protein [Gammaproteobacteria bacterium]